MPTEAVQTGGSSCDGGGGLSVAEGAGGGGATGAAKKGSWYWGMTTAPFGIVAGRALGEDVALLTSSPFLVFLLSILTTL